jgi:hypothetical protein
MKTAMNLLAGAAVLRLVALALVLSAFLLMTAFSETLALLVCHRIPITHLV